METQLKIGVAITVHNRNLIAINTVKAWRTHLPKGARLVVVDDASSVPYCCDYVDEVFRFEKNAGIAKAKNKCIELLDGCDYLFLSDDDCYPIVNDWFRPYIESGHNHLSLTFCSTLGNKPNGRTLIGTKDAISEYSKPCGCMMFLTKDVVDKIGGFDEGYGKWGMEHIDYSNRAFNSGVSSVRYGDIENPLEYFRSLDYERAVPSSTSVEDKKKCLGRNRARFELFKNSSKYIAYKKENNPSKSAVIASYFNYRQDPQRKEVWDNDISKIVPLLDSVHAHGVRGVILHDCFGVDAKNFELTAGDPSLTPNAFRWFAQMEWIERNNPEKVFMVDSTDVIMLKDPFPNLESGLIYCGYEHGNNMMNKWMWGTQGRFLKIRDWGKTLRENGRHVLLNCGVFGGYTEDVLPFLRTLCAYHDKHSRGLKTSSDMSMFNYVAMKHFKDKIVTGELVTTKFKQNETNEISWFKHK